MARPRHVPGRRRRNRGTAGGVIGARLELGVELGAQVEGVIAQLDDLHQAVIGREAAEDQPVGGEQLAEFIIELEAMAVPLVDHRLPVGGAGAGALGQATGPGTQAHGAALVRDIALLGHQVDHRVFGESVELGAVGLVAVQQLAG